MKSRGFASRSPLPAWVGIGLAAFLLTAHLFYYAYLDVDDAYIAYRYARNFARGEGLLFNPGEQPVEGYSAFLWVMVLGGFARMGFDLPTIATALGGGLSVLAFIGTGIGVRRTAISKYTVWAGTLWLAASGAYAMWSMSGMETGMVAGLIVLSLLVLDGEDRSGEGYRSGFVLALLALARAEGAIFFVAAALVRTLAHLRGLSSRPAREEAKWILAFAVPVSGFLMWRLGYYGEWLPNAVYAKAGGGYLYHALRGGYYLFQFIASGGALLAILVVATALLRWNRPLIRHALLGSAAYVATIVLAGGDWMPQFRFFAPILPVLCLLAAVGLEAVTDEWMKARGAQAAVFSSSVAALLFAVFVGGSIQAQEIERTTRDFVSPTAGGHLKAAWLRRHSRPGDSIALVDSGILGYETELRVIDMIGLNDAHIAHLPPRFPRGLAPGNGLGKWDIDYVLELEPTYIQVHLSRRDWEERRLLTDWVGTDELINDPRFLAAYKYIDDSAMGGVFVRVGR